MFDNRLRLTFGVLALLASVPQCSTRNERPGRVAPSRTETKRAGGEIAGGPVRRVARTVVPAVLAVPVVQPRLGEPLTGLSQAQLARFEAGRTAFDRVIRPEHGLGPAHNLFSCRACHSNPPGGSGTISVTMFGMRTEDGFDPLKDLGGALLQGEAISGACAERVPSEANIIVERLTTSTLGAGLIDAISAEDLRRLEENPPPGVSGRVNWVHALEDAAGAPPRAGRFGWKCQIATLLSFSAAAARNELGFTNRFLPEEAPPNGDFELAARCDRVPDPEDRPDAEGLDYVDRVTDFQRFLAAPPQTPRSGMSGELVFHRIGCADCHVPSLTTADVPSVERPLRGRVIKPYSDFLVHDMGSLGDGIVQGRAEGSEFRTTPLWGLRIRFPLLHDGRISRASLADRVTAAILAHSGEAEESVRRFKALSANDRQKLHAFLDSLGRVEFDDDGDNDVDLADYKTFAGCITGVAPGVYTPDARCSISDVDQDGDVDMVDYSVLQRAFTGRLYGSTMVVP